MKSKYLMVAMLTLGLSSVAGAVGCNNDIDCEKINCEKRIEGVTIILQQNGIPYDKGQFNADDHATCKKIGGEAHGKTQHCTCNITINI